MKHTTGPLAYLDGAIAGAARQGLLRERVAPRGRARAPSFCSNDYLGLAGRHAPVAAGGAGGSRLVSGERAEHGELEHESAGLVGLPSALVFSSGYAANVGWIPALAGPGDLVVSDALNHASIIDGIRLARCRTVVAPHLDLDAVEAALRGRREGRAFVVTESYFSMDADSPDLGALRALCDRYGAALAVDEAHALGVLGPGGAGLCVEAGVTPDILVGTFGKAFGAAGAFVAGCPALTTWLWNRARSFVFSTGLSPAVARAAIAGIRTAAAEPERRERALAASTELRTGLEALGVHPPGRGLIVPWLLGDPWRAVEIARALYEDGIDTRAIRPPSVPAGTARIRFTVTAAHKATDIAGALASVARLLPGPAR